MFDPLRAVPYDAANVEFIIEHASALVRRAVQRRHAPRSATRATDAARIEVRREALTRFAGTVAIEDLTHNRRLLGHDD